MSLTQKLAGGSIAVGVLVLATKFIAYALTGSVALLSDALESVVNVATALGAYWALHVSAQPADARHPYGHTKAEYLSAVAEGVLIVVAALAIFREAADAFAHPRPLEQPVAGLLVSMLASGVNAAWAFTLLRIGRRVRSPALVADGKHLKVDVITSIGVIVGVVLVFVTGQNAIDPVVASLVALNVLWSGWMLMRESVGGLMDEAMPEIPLSRVRDLIAANADGAIEAHDIKTRCAGKLTFVEFHLVVPGGMRVSEAHDICDRIERVLKADVPDTAVTIHVEPEDKKKHLGIVVV